LQQYFDFTPISAEGGTGPGARNCLFWDLVDGNQTTLGVPVGSAWWGNGFTINFWTYNPVGSGILFQLSKNEVWGPPSLFINTESAYFQYGDAILDISGYTIPQESWAMVTLIHTASTSTIEYYVSQSGEPQKYATGTYITPPADVDAFSIGTFYTTIPDLNGSSMQRSCLTGVWTRVLSPSEIDELYNAGSGLAYSEL
jgi:hypothetical protein